jgi:hypothetical protein
MLTLNVTNRIIMKITVWLIPTRQRFDNCLLKKFNYKFNKFCFFHSKYYLHEVAAQEEDMECKRILLTAREKQNIVNYCLERGELTPLI